MKSVNNMCIICILFHTLKYYQYYLILNKQLARITAIRNSGTQRFITPMTEPFCIGK